MENRLRKLRNSMEKSTFEKLSFSDKIREQVKEEIHTPIENEDDVMIAILQLLHQEKTGFELTSLLRARGIKKFENEEGFLYTVLHRLEQNRFIRSAWDNEGIKTYEINDKGKKLVRKAEKSVAAKNFNLKELLGE
ncbi:PadR family transcriptional regulator [Bacillus sp. JJ1122]|uniref:PadR family transcriptional regulator n=1 Tax=Bacillus sp. JJ1122 TaxID=3122951 RepID=UPI002FFFC402